jgi:hypothetical protein
VFTAILNSNNKLVNFNLNTIVLINFRNMQKKPWLSRRQTIVVLVILVFISLIGYCQIKTTSDLEDPKVHSKKAPQEYLELFNSKNRELIMPDEIDYFEHEYPIAGFYADNKKYVIQVYKLGESGNGSLKNLISLTGYPSNMPSGLSYRTFRENLFTLMFRPYHKVINNINFNLGRQSLTQLASNDSLLSVYTQFKNFSLQYNHVDTIKVFGKPGQFVPRDDDDSNATMPIIITFIKKKQFIYLIIVAAHNSGTTLEPNVFNEFIYPETH